MIKSVNYIYTLILIISLISCNQQNRENNKDSENDNTEETNTIAANNKLSLEMYDKLMNSFGKDWMERESDPDLYPDYYGGSFIDNNGNFVIALTNNSQKVQELLIEALETDNFKTETVQYSYRQMLRVMDSIDEFLINNSIPDDHVVLSHFAGAYPDVMENRVKVLFTEVNQSIINSFKRDVINSPMVIFEKGEIPELY
ncbi:MAG TPA: hypothetical protein VKX35_10430 [Fermentimonas sp.]|nr:hypothetical protein [Fermentimonas sp.]